MLPQISGRDIFDTPGRIEKLATTFYPSFNPLHAVTFENWKERKKKKEKVERFLHRGNVFDINNARKLDISIAILFSISSYYSSGSIPRLIFLLKNSSSLENNFDYTTLLPLTPFLATGLEFKERKKKKAIPLWFQLGLGNG